MARDRQAGVMTAADLIALTPLIALALGGTVVMLAGALGARPSHLHGITVGSIGIALAAAGVTRTGSAHDVTTLLRFDDYSFLFLMLLLSATGILAIVSRPYLQARRREGEAFYALLLFAATGMGVLACSIHFLALFLGLEILAVSLYPLLGYLRSRNDSLEAAAKYLILAALASGLILFGIALVYAATGTLLLRPAMQQIGSLLVSGTRPEAIWAMVGMGFLIAGFAFKLALVPFHMWSPDVYQGAPAPVTALIATGSKGAVVAVLARLLAPGINDGTFAAMLAGLAVLSMFSGNLLALLQNDIKRLLAYSSVAHLGYVFVALTVGGAAGNEALVFYMLTYVAATLGALGVVTVLSCDADVDADNLRSYRGLGRRRPALALLLTVMFLSLAGVPPTGGFLAKFAVLGAAVEADRIGLALAMVVASGIALYYYLRVLVVMYMEPDDESLVAAGPATPLASSVALAALAIFVLAIGIFPEPWLRAVDQAVAAIF